VNDSLDHLEIWKPDGVAVEFAEYALFVLDEVIGHANDGNDGLSKDDAEALLADDDRFTETDAEYALDVLQSRRHIYYVDEWVYITPTDD
jgi:hypothetical protein